MAFGVNNDLTDIAPWNGQPLDPYWDNCKTSFPLGEDSSEISAGYYISCTRAAKATGKSVSDLVDDLPGHFGQGNSFNAIDIANAYDCEYADDDTERQARTALMGAGYRVE